MVVVVTQGFRLANLAAVNLTSDAEFRYRRQLAQQQKAGGLKQVQPPEDRNATRIPNAPLVAC